METLSTVAGWLLDNWDTILMAIPAAIGVFAVVARVTPTTADDAVVQWLYDNVHRIAQNKPFIERLRDRK
jgi:hypothetical protein